MSAINRMYTTLFNAITDALELLERGNVPEAVQLLRESQQTAEELYMESEELD